MSKGKKQRPSEAQRSRMQAEKHIVICPHCGAQALDHMTQCPKCKGELIPRGYRPMDEKKLQKIQRITLIVGLVVAAIVILVLYLTK